MAKVRFADEDDTATISGASPSSAPKTKTKAKKRYLRAKMERRKQRKTGLLHARDSVQPTTRNGQSDDKSEAESDASSIPEEEPTAVTSVSGQETSDIPRPKKRRKLETTGDDVEDTIMLAESEEPAEAHRMSATAQQNFGPTLPSFPLPTRPDAPSRSTLALQGQDKALIEAELVDPRKTTKIDEAGIGEKTIRRLKDLGIQELFAVQTAVIPYLLSHKTQRALYLPYNPPSDLCVSAPTGSGKTLAYVVPIVEILATRVVTRLRALIVLPTRDLVVQVREIFEEVAKGRGLKVGAITGQHSFSHEQAQLVAERDTELQGGSSKIDVLICTPGRLIDHINLTRNFSLQHLRFLVVDEADRLLAQSFQDWLAQVLAATKPTISVHSRLSGDISPHIESSQLFSNPDALAPAFLHLFRDTPYIHTVLDEAKETSCQKLLFSATLTRDPSKIAALNLRDPKYFIVQSQSKTDSTGQSDIVDVVMEKFTMPATLQEHMIVCEPSQKPLILFYLVHSLGVKNAIVFAKSAESTTRLVQLFEFLEASRTAGQAAPVVIHAYSSDLSPNDRKTILEKFRNQEIDILVCSDLISRGIDITHVSHVVSYDAPVDMRKYVHRVGRTARAGREGHAWTLVEEQEAHHFKSFMRNAEHLEALKRLRIQQKDLSSLLSHYDAALEKLKQLYVRT